MKITSWNVNSIRARLEHVLDWLEENDPDVLCLQEIKVQDEHFPEELFVDAGWEVYLNGQRTYNGVALISKEPLAGVVTNTNIEILDEQSRIIAADVGDVRVYNVYAPNGKAPDTPSFAFKEAWYAAFTDFIAANHKPTDKLVICGDFNIAPADIDVWDADKMLGHCCFHPSEHKWLKHLMDFGLIDSFRNLYPNEQAFTWWDYRQASFQRNSGMRIDHHLVSQSLLPLVKDVVLDKAERAKERPSDHIPVTLVLK